MNQHSTTPLDVLKTLPLPSLLQLAGFTVKGSMAGPCPLCGTNRRGRSDPRLPLNIGNGGWHCHSCDEGGTLIDTAIRRMLGRTPESREDWRELFELMREEGFDVDAKVPPPLRGDPEPEEELPPVPQSILDGWTQAPRMEDAPRWMRERGLRIEEGKLDIRRWADGSLALAFQNARGEVQGVRTRNAEGKPRGPKGSQVGMLTCTYGDLLLEGPEFKRQPLTLVICEGETDLLALAPIIGDRMLWALVNGTWASDAFGDRIPPGTTVLLATDGDEKGDLYAEQIALDLQMRPDLTLVRTVASWTDPSLDWADIPEEDRLTTMQLNRRRQDIVWPPEEEGEHPAWGLLRGWDPSAEGTEASFLMRDADGRGVMEQGTVGMLNGRTTLGKTWLLLQMAVAVSTGTPFLDWQTPDPGPVLVILAEENSSQALRRIAAVTRQSREEGGAGIKFDSLLRKNLHVVSMAEIRSTYRLLGVSGPTHGSLEEAPLFRFIVKVLPLLPFRMLILDPLPRLIPMAESSPEIGTQAVGLLEDLRLLGPGSSRPTVLISHHTAKGGGGRVAVTSGRGSGALGGAARFSFLLRDFEPAPEENPHILQLHLDGNEGAKHDLLIRRTLTGPFEPVPDYEERTIRERYPRRPTR